MTWRHRAGAAVALVVASVACSASDRALQLGATGGTGGTGGAGGADAGSGGTSACSSDLLTDPANCGRCGHSCLGGGCAKGMCLPITLASGLKQCQGVAVDGAWVYFADYLGAVVSKVDASGGAPVLVAGNQAGAFLIAASSGVVAWGNADSGVVMRLAQGAAPKTIATGRVAVAP